MLIDAPLELFHEYTQRMMAWLLLVEPESMKQCQAMQLGLGAVSLTKFCHKKLGMQTTAIELNRQVLHACRSWFRLPADNRRLQVILNDAALEIQDARWWGAVDSLQVDLYDDEAAAPVLDSLPFYNGVLRSGKCFCPSLTPERCGNYKGHGTPLPLCAKVYLVAAAARGIGTDGACFCKPVHRVEPSIPWLWVRQIALRLTWPTASGRVQIALHGLRIRRASSTSLGVVNCGSRRKSLSALASERPHRWRSRLKGPASMPVGAERVLAVPHS
jgi:hypothetical protein